MIWLPRTGMAVVLLLAHSAWAAASAAPSAERCNREQFRVILDVGHTAEVPGAMSARGVGEYEFNLRLATGIKQKLADAGFARTVLLVTAGPARPSLIKRVTLANRAPAQLFLSIHHDSVPAQFKESWDYEGKANQFSDRFKGHSLFISNDNADPRASLQFGRLLGKELKTRDLQYTPHYTQPFMGRRQRLLVDADVGVYRYDQLIVLRMTRMPAVLLEAGSIVNRDEELAMASPERQALIGDAVTEAVAAFCAARAPQQPQQPQQPRRPGKPEAVSAATTKPPR